MLEHLILENSFWKFLVSIEELKEKKEVFLFCSSLGIDEEVLSRYCDFLNRFKVSVEHDERYVYPLQEQCRIKMEFTLAEWLALQASFPQLAKSSMPDAPQYYEQIVHNKLQMAQKAFEQFSLFKKPSEKVVELSALENLKKKINYCIVYRRSMKISFFTQKECAAFPHRLVFLDGVLCVAGENVADKSLVYFGVEDIASIEELSLSYEPNLSQIEVSEFIGHLRLINGKEERLVLKIYSQDQADLLPAHHYLGNPFVTSGADGDLIWAATIEMCDDIFQWLYMMRDRVEVLDPGHVRKEFAHFCELKKEKGQSKKAS